MLTQLAKLVQLLPPLALVTLAALVVREGMRARKALRCMREHYSNTIRVRRNYDWALHAGTVADSPQYPMRPEDVLA